MPFDLCALLRAHAVTTAIDLALTALLFYPLGWFACFDWSARKNEFCNSLNDRAKQSYLQVFHKRKALRLEDASDAFDAFYYEWFGWRKLVLPLLFLFLAALIENFILAQAIQKAVSADVKPKDFPIAAAAIGGAYTFICWDMFNRMQRRTLSHDDVLRASLRLVAAIPIGYAFAPLLAESLAPFVAFAIGAFPIAALNVILQRQIKKRLELETGDPKAARDQVFLLSGVDTTIAERLEDADISTITQLAWADPIEVAIRTNLQFIFVVDIVSQALAWAYLEDKLQPMGVAGLRSAIEIRILLRDIGIIEDAKKPDETEQDSDRVVVETHRVIERLDAIEVTDERVEIGPADEDDAAGNEDAAGKEDEDDPDSDRALGLAAVKAAAKIVKVEVAALKYALVQIGADPTAEFLETCWRSLTDPPDIGGGDNSPL